MHGQIKASWKDSGQMGGEQYIGDTKASGQKGSGGLSWENAYPRMVKQEESQAMASRTRQRTKWWTGRWGRCIRTHQHTHSQLMWRQNKPASSTSRGHRHPTLSPCTTSLTLIWSRLHLPTPPHFYHSTHDRTNPPHAATLIINLHLQIHIRRRKMQMHQLSAMPPFPKEENRFLTKPPAELQKHTFPQSLTSSSSCPFLVHSWISIPTS